MAFGDPSPWMIRCETLQLKFGLCEAGGGLPLLQYHFCLLVSFSGLVVKDPRLIVLEDCSPPPDGLESGTAQEFMITIATVYLSKVTTRGCTLL